MGDENADDGERSNNDTQILQQLGPGSYTGHLFRHANHEHIHLTTRRRFIGPVPEGWLTSNRKSWFRQSTRTFVARTRASTNTGHKLGRKRRLTGFEGPSAAAAYHPSFPQPDDVDEPLEDEEEEQNGQEDVDEDRSAEGEGRDMPSRVATRSLDVGSSGERFDNSSETSTIRAAQGTVPSTIQALPIASTNGEQTVKLKSTNKSRQSSSYETAAETFGIPDGHKTSALLGTFETGDMMLDGQGLYGSRVTSTSSIGNGVDESTAAGPQTSTASLITKTTTTGDPASSRKNGDDYKKSILGGKQHAELNQNLDGATQRISKRKSPQPGLVRFNVHGSTDVPKSKSRPFGTASQRVSTFRRKKEREGQIVKMERMLVRVHTTKQKLSKEFDENESRKVDTKVIEKWREFMVVCREGDRSGAGLNLQIYKTRVIPATSTNPQTKKKAKYEIPLKRRRSNVNLFSSLDKSLVIWVATPKKTFIYILKSRSGSNAVEWFTFLQKVLGWQRPSELPISIPDLGIALRIKNPFEGLESLIRSYHDSESKDMLFRTMQKEQNVASEILRKSIEMLLKIPEWQDVMRKWQDTEKLGLAWRRYDRLEWIHGTQERRMYGTMAMLKTHELEMRSKRHYATEVALKDGGALVEPWPLEGFLIRLTTQRGSERSLGRMYYKRLYFSTHDQFLVFTRPANAQPPAYTALSPQNGQGIPSASHISDNLPKMWDVNPFSLKDGEITWLKNDVNCERIREKDQRAVDETQRKITSLVECDGYIDLCNVRSVRNVIRDAVPADANIDEGSDVDFNFDVPDTLEDDGMTRGFDDERTFELKMKNGLVVRLQTHDNETKREWMKFLRKLIRYWKLRTKADIALYKFVKNTNLERLNLDEEMEAFVGQFAQKWEVTKSFASADLYNLCGIASCRAIHMSGTLFLKPRLHATFNRCSVILSYGKLLIFRDAVRTRSGRALPHVHHDRASTFDLKECYLYSGVLTENDLLYQNQAFDRDHPGHNVLPRIFVEDDWTSMDEEYMTCFVLWHGRHRSFFRSTGDEDDGDGEENTAGSAGGSRRNRLKLVSQLGVPGRSIVFKCRSRAERDHWVMAISLEIERLQQSEDVRITEDEEG